MKTTIILLLIAVIGLLSVQAQPPQGDLLSDLLSDPGCQSACFLGIGIGDNYTEVETILDSMSISYTNNGFDYPNSFLYYFETTQTAPFIPSGEGASWVGISVVNGIVVGIQLGVDISITTIAEAYGNPKSVLKSNFPDNYYVAYPSEGLVFLTGENVVSGHVDVVAIMTASDIENVIIGGGSFTSVSDTCSSYGVLPCIMPTATLLPGGSPTPTPTNTPASDLPDLTPEKLKQLQAHNWLRGLWYTGK